MAAVLVRQGGQLFLLQLFLWQLFLWQAVLLGRLFGSYYDKQDEVYKSGWVRYFSFGFIFFFIRQ